MTGQQSWVLPLLGSTKAAVATVTADHATIDLAGASTVPGTVWLPWVCGCVAMPLLQGKYFLCYHLLQWQKVWVLQTYSLNIANMSRQIRSMANIHNRKTLLNWEKENT